MNRAFTSFHYVLFIYFSRNALSPFATIINDETQGQRNQDIGMVCLSPNALGIRLRRDKDGSSYNIGYKIDLR